MTRELCRMVEENCRRLETSDKTMAAIYEVVFRPRDNVLAEYDDGFRVHRTTYGQAQAQIERVSAALHERLGATHGYVGLEMENSERWIVAFWAILRSGNKPWLVNTRHPQALSQRIAEDLGVPITGAAPPVIRRPKKNSHGQYTNWYRTTLPWMSIGYESQVPPISTLTFYNAIANNGKMMKPRFVKKWF